MNIRKRILALFLASVLILVWMPVEASANSPEPTPYFTFYLSNLPERTEYVDLLVYLPETDDMYVDLITRNIPDSFSQDAPILTYCENDYRSYTFHYRDALSMIHIGKEGSVRYFTDDVRKWDETHIRFDHAADIDIRGKVMLAMLDARGNILQISHPLDLTNVREFSYRLGSFYYDCATGELTISQAGGNMLDPPGLYILSSVFGILITCALECLVSLLFKLKGYIGTVAWTNVASQILMRLAYAALYLFTSWNYMTMTLVLEGLIFLGEFLWYLWKMDEVSWPASLAFTITANSVSWLLGHLINLIVFFGVFIMI